MEQLMKSYMAIMAERDAAIRERNMALVEKKKALADRDMAILQRDTAIAQRNGAMLERNDAIDALQCRDSSMNGNNLIPGPPGHGMRHGAKHMHQQQQHMPHFAEAAYSPREVPFSDDFPNAAVASETAAKPRKVKQTKETKAVSSKKPSKSCKRGKRGTKVLSKQVTIATLNGWKNGQDLGEELNRQLGESENEWKDHLGLKDSNFDDATMPVPVCSCTGVLQPCYKWGNGGWQSACCTTTLSMYPLPQMPNKRHSRLGGRKMSGSAFTKLLSRLAAEGRDLSLPLDLKDHWAKHGTNRYITIK